jgi:hypothetical protein
MLTAGAQAENLPPLGSTDLGGQEDCMHVVVQGGIACGQHGRDRVGTSTVDVSDAAPSPAAHSDPDSAGYLCTQFVYTQLGPLYRSKESL